ncbi:MAG TPA: hypothetical protein VFR90_06885 [Methylibium sp.]|uniref:hypothetical protein n=1 Tax=Methylibium sp. TaxID=2067992 RepID=UPI002DBFA4F8|nr:hypothetical protein [Methylibium sp.]HEU4458831.1 hypothetical protein [Methylibium sp.]
MAGMDPTRDPTRPATRPQRGDESLLESLGRAMSDAVRDTAATSSREEQIDAVYRDLHRGLGRDRVTDDNVEALIARAREHGDAQLELLLREWRSPCGDDPDAPDPRSLRKLPPAR